MLRGTDNMQDFGAYVVYVNALLTDELDAGIAGEYGIVRSNNRALLTFSVHRKEENGVTSAVQSQVSSSAVNMTGQLKTVLLREISEDEAIYYIGELDVIHGETLIYTINATPHGESDRLTLRYQKQFFADL